MEEKRGVGRPKKPACYIKCKQIRIRMTEAEYNLLKSVSKNEKKSMSKVIIESINERYRDIFG